MGNSIKQNNTPVIEKEKQLIKWLEMPRDIKLKYFNENIKKKSEGYIYAGQEDLLLQHGRFYRADPLTDEEREYVEHQIKHLGFIPKERRCWYNSQMLALNSGRRVNIKNNLQIKYHEGQADANLIPVEHGFNTINGKLIDITWKHRSGVNKNKHILGDVPTDWCYFGVEIDKRLAADQQLETGMADSVLALNQELYKKRFLPEVIKEHQELFQTIHKKESGGFVETENNIQDNRYKESLSVFYNDNGLLAYNNEQL